MRKFLFLLVAAFSFTSCAAQPKEAVYTEPAHFTIDTLVRTYSVDYTPKFTSGSDLLTYRGETWLMINQCGANTVLFKNVQKDSVLRLILQNPDCEKIHSAITAAGIYLVLRDGSVLLYPHGKSTPSERYNLFTDSELFRKSGLRPEWSKGGGDQRVEVSDGNVFFRVNQNLDDDDKGMYSKYKVAYPIVAKLDLATKAVQFYGETPRYVADGDYGYLSHLYDLYKGDSVLFSKPINGEISLVDTKTGKRMEWNIPSSYQEKPVEKLYVPRRKRKDWTRLKAEHALLSAYYEPLFYNPYDRHYYRVFHPAMPKYNAEGLLNTAYDKSNVLMVFNDRLELEEEVVLPFKFERIPRLMPVPGGVEFIMSIVADKPYRAEFKMMRILRK